MRIQLFCTCLLAAMSVQAQRTMADWWREMPDTIIPMLSRGNRLDMVDFIDNNMEARVTNVLDGKSVMDTLTADYLHVTLTPQTVLEMKVVADDRILMARTAAGQSTELHIYNKEWCEVPSDIVWPNVDDYLEGNVIKDDLKSRLIDAALVSVKLSPTDSTLTFTLHPDDLPKEDVKTLKPLCQLVFRNAAKLLRITR